MEEIKNGMAYLLNFFLMPGELRRGVWRDQRPGAVNYVQRGYWARQAKRETSLERSRQGRVRVVQRLRAKMFAEGWSPAPRVAPGLSLKVGT